MPHLESDFWQPLKNRGLSVLVIAREQPLKEIAPFKSEMKLTMPVGLDSDRSVYSKFAAKGIPRTFLIDRSGKIAFAAVGYRQEEFTRLKSVIAKELTPPSPLEQVCSELSEFKYDSAIARLKTILQKCPRNAQAHYLLAVAYARTKRFAEAEPEYKQAIKISPNKRLRDLAELELAKLHPGSNQ